jgi:uncharacterized membrane protein YphA (DoxX/SURF4 family)
MDLRSAGPDAHGSGSESPKSKPSQNSIARPHWGAGTRVIFRFCVVYFGLFCLGTQIFGGLIHIPKVDIPDVSMLPPIHPLVLWTAKHVFQVQTPLVDSGSGSGDKTFDWVMCFCFVMLAAAAALVWSLLDRKRTSYPGLQKWFRVLLRFSLGAQMLGYGFVKVIPMQMPYPSLIKLLEPYGNFSPMGVLWYSIGAEPAYEILCGSAEVLAGVLLLIPRTTLLGALVTMGVTSEIFVLNMTYDVPVKLFSFHLLLMALFLAAPELSRLLDFFLWNRPVGVSTQPRLFRTMRANRIALAAQLVFAAWLIGSTIYGYAIQWPVWGGGRPLSPLYGIWNIEKLVIDGHERSPLLTDYGRWRRILFDSPKYFTFERMDETFSSYESVIDEKKQTMALTKSDDKKWKGTLHYQRVKPDELMLDGEVGGQSMHIQLARMDRNKLMLVSRGFHWVQEYPFNR